MTLDKQKAIQATQAFFWAHCDGCQLREVAGEMMARIEELEQALIEERAQWIAMCKDIGTDPSDHYITDDVVLIPAREQLKEEGY